MNRQKINETQLNAVSIIAITSVILIAKGDYKMNLTYTPTGSALPPRANQQKKRKRTSQQQTSGEILPPPPPIGGGILPPLPPISGAVVTQPSTSGQNDNKKRKTSPSPSDIQAVNRLAPDYLPDATVSEAYKRGLDKFNKLDNQVDYLFDYFENQQKKGLHL